jgi:hypothetical protein
MIAADGIEALIAGKEDEVATIPRHAHLLGIARQFVWMEFFTQRIYTRPGAELLERIEPQDRQVFASLIPMKESHDEKRNKDNEQHH